MCYKNIFIRLIFPFVVLIFFSKCKPLPPQPPPSAGPVTFVIYEPANNNCYARHQGSGVPTTKIKLAIFIKTKYINPRNAGADYITYDEKPPVIFDPAVDTWPISIIANAPNKNPWYCEVNIQGIECAECANGYGLPTESSGQCSANVFLTTPRTYQGAKPRWQSQFTFQNYVTTANLMLYLTDRIPNLPNTCNSSCIIY